jgi:hypothetical protein
VQRRAKRIEDITAEVEVGRSTKARCCACSTSARSSRCCPGKDGLLHISQIAKERVNQVSDYVKEGQIVRVKVLEADDKGRPAAVDEGRGGRRRGCGARGTHPARQPDADGTQAEEKGAGRRPFFSRALEIAMTDSSTRIERDSFGPIEVPADRLWGAQTQRSLEHFRISTEKMPQPLIRALAIVKRSAARVMPRSARCRNRRPTPSSPRRTRCSPGSTPMNSRSPSGRRDRERRPT